MRRCGSALHSASAVTCTFIRPTPPPSPFFTSPLPLFPQHLHLVIESTTAVDESVVDLCLKGVHLPRVWVGNGHHIQVACQHRWLQGGITPCKHATQEEMGCAVRLCVCCFVSVCPCLSVYLCLRLHTHTHTEHSTAQRMQQTHARGFPSNLGNGRGDCSWQQPRARSGTVGHG